MSKHFKIREIDVNDYYKGYISLINVFTKNPTPISFKDFAQQLKCILNQNSIILVAEQDGIIVGTLKILKEYKLHNNLALMAHIEDVVVSSNYRKM